MAHSHFAAPRPLRAKDLDPLLTELTAISRQAEDIQHRIAVLQAGGVLLRPGWPMRRVTPIDDPLPSSPEAEDQTPAGLSEEGSSHDPPAEATATESSGALADTEGSQAEEDPLTLILRIAGDLEELRSRDDAPSAAELQIRAIRDRIARSAALSAAYLPEASASI